MLSGERVRRVLLVAWKDLLDLRRDTRTLLGIIVLPFIGLPGLALLSGALAGEQAVTVCFAYDDASSTGLPVAERIVERTVEILRGWGYRAVLVEGSAGRCDLLVRIPEGFSDALESLDGQAVVEASGALGGAGQQALYALRLAVQQVSREIAADRVGRLAGMAGVEVSVDGVLQPVRVEVAYHTAGGAPATSEMVAVSESARILAFSLFFVVNPVVVFMSDAIAGEKERRTLEMLLLSPVTRGELLAGKVLAASVAGLIGAAADSLGMLAYFSLAGYDVQVTMGLALVWLASAAGLIGFTAFVTGVIAARSGSMRASQNLSFLLTTAAMAVYFAALIVDYTRLAGPVKAVLSLIPFAQAAFALEYYSVGLPGQAALYLAGLAASSVAAGLVLVRAFDYEKVLASDG